VARAQQPVLPVVGFINPGSVDTSARNLAAFRAGLSETGYVEGQNVLVEYYWLEGQVDRLPAFTVHAAALTSPAMTVRRFIE
jgi:putative ABC transport system substrate-binding protein